MRNSRITKRVSEAPAASPGPDSETAPQAPETEGDAQQLREGMNRLEQLLADGTPGITVSPQADGGSDDANASADVPPASYNRFADDFKPIRLSDLPGRGSVDTTPTQSATPAQPLPAPAAAPEPEAPSSQPELEAAAAQRLAPDGAPVADTQQPSTLDDLPSQARQKLAALAEHAKGKDTSDEPSAPADNFRLRRDGELWTALTASRRAIVATGAFSLVINLLMLTGPLFMLQVYDRVMTSGSIPTLVALSLLTALLYAVIGFMELIRSRVVIRVGLEFDRRIADRVFKSSLRKSLKGPVGSPALRELDHIRQFISGPGPITAFDAPWTPIYLMVIFMMHPWLGVAASIGTVVLLGLAWTSERLSRGPLVEAGKSSGLSFEMAETGQRNAEAITAMGMLEAYRKRWQKTNSEALAWQVLAADRLGTLTSITKALRLALQSMMLAIGAALALNNEISAGTIVAATIIFGRALAPVEQAVGHWRGMLRAFEGYGRLDDLLRSSPEPEQRTNLPTPAGHLEVKGLRVAAPDTRQLILSNLNFAVEPGQMLAVIGPSASGKSTLARALVGLWPPFSGSIRLDGARLDQWSGEDLGQHIGYLPQSVELFSGTVRDNIARFREGASDDDIVAAAKQAHAHELILALPQGYETQVGAFATYLSAGQRQRIALARALFGDPKMVVLDEPNANLDRVGDEALASAIDGMRARGQAVVLVSHRVQAITKADLLLYIDRGMQRAFGPRDDVMRMFQSGAGQAAAGGEQRDA